MSRIYQWQFEAGHRGYRRSLWPKGCYWDEHNERNKTMTRGTLIRIEENKYKDKPYLRVQVDKDWYTIWNEKMCEVVKAIGTGHEVEFETKVTDSGKVNITKIQPTGNGGTTEGSGNGWPPSDQAPAMTSSNGRESDEVKATRISRMNALTNAVAVLTARGFTDDSGARIPDGKVVKWVTGLADRFHHFTMTGEVNKE